MPGANYRSKLPLFVLAGMAPFALSCKIRPDGSGGKVRSDGSPVVRGTFDIFAESPQIGSAWNSKTGDVLPNSCVRGIGVGTSKLTFPLATAPLTPAPTSTLPVVGTNPIPGVDPGVPVQPGVTPQPGVTQPGVTPQPGVVQPAVAQPGATQPAATQPAATQPGATPPAGPPTQLRLTEDTAEPSLAQILARYPTAEEAAQNRTAFINNFETLSTVSDLQAKAVAAEALKREGAATGNGLFLDGETPAAVPGTAPAGTPTAPATAAAPAKIAQADLTPAAQTRQDTVVSKKLAEQVTCNELEMVNWITDLAKEKNDNPVAVEQRIVVVTDVSSAAEALGISGGINMNLIKGIGMSAQGGASNAINIDSNSTSLFIDTIVGFNGTTWRSAPSQDQEGNQIGGFNAVNVGLTEDWDAKLSKNPTQEAKDEFAQTCGDKWIFSTVRGSRYTTRFVLSNKAKETQFKADASGSLDGLQIGPTAINVAGKFNMDNLSGTATQNKTQVMFSQLSGSVPTKMPETPACMLALAAALPKATRKPPVDALGHQAPAQVVAFAVGAYPKAQSGVDRVLSSGETVAKEYVQLLQKMGRYADQLFQVFNHPEHYNFFKRSDFDTAITTAKSQLSQLTGTNQDPQAVWTQLRDDDGCRQTPACVSIGTVIAHAKSGVDKILDAGQSQEERTAAFKALGEQLKVDSAAFEAFRNVYKTPDQNSETFVTDLTAEKGQEIVVNTKTAAEAARFCSAFNRAPEGSAKRKLTDFLSARTANYTWRLPTVNEAARIRWASKVLLHTSDAGPDNRLFINAVKPGTRATGDKPTPVRANINFRSGDTVPVSENPDEKSFTICVYGDQTAF